MYTCELCNYNTQRKHDLKKHTQSIKHTTLQKQLKESSYSFVCEKCHKRFPKSRDLKRHSERKNPCTIRVNIDGDHNITQIGDHNSVINNFNINLITPCTDIDALRKDSVVKDDKFLLMCVNQDAVNLDTLQHEFNHIAEQEALEAIAKLRNKKRKEEEFYNRMVDQGAECELEHIDPDKDYVISFSKVVIRAILQNNNLCKALSVFRAPGVNPNGGKWFVKFRNKACDPELIFSLLGECKHRDHFDVKSDFKQLLTDEFIDSYKHVIKQFNATIDRKRNGYNIRSRHDD